MNAKMGFRKTSDGWVVRVLYGNEMIESGPAASKSGARSNGFRALSEIVGIYWAPGVSKSKLPKVTEVSWESMR